MSPLAVLALLALASAPRALGYGLNTHHRRDTTDTCAYIGSTALSVDVGPEPVTIGILLPQCLCQSTIPAMVDSPSNVVIIAAVEITGEAAVESALDHILATSSAKQTCTYPEHATPACAPSDVCGFTCSDGFAASGATCACPAPNSVCNGQCGSFPAGCPSAVPVKKRAELERRRASCPAGLTACGVYGWSELRAAGAYECVDARADIESCGGCVIPLTDASPHGVDCTVIPGVEDVSCVRGKCAVYSCLPGYTVSPDNKFCVRAAAQKQSPVTPVGAAKDAPWMNVFGF